MADGTSQATHLAQLDLDISAIEGQLKSVEQNIQETAARIKKSLKETADKTTSEQTSNSVKATKANLESLMLAYANFQKRLANTKLTPEALKNIPKQAEEARNALSALIDKIQNGGNLTEKENAEFKKLQSTLKQLKTELADTETIAKQTGEGFQTMGGAVEATDNKLKGFIQRLGSKAFELASYQIVMALQQAFSETVNVMKETEDAVIDIQRALNDDSISNSAMSKELYDIASEYGQTFDNVSEAATRFAQAGLTWNEVIDATRATMLGLNTAELEITTATSGLIAVMTQFGYKSSDLEGIIDKINITADNFAVTSEKIVAALQRVGATAKNSNVSLEESIAIITALSEATGRSGENIGTALNSLMVYMTKAKSLDMFASISDGMAKVVADYRKGSGSIIDIWSQLSTELKRMNQEQQEALFKSDMWSQFADFLEAEATDITATVEEVYGTAGTYRRNYAIALLNDWDKIEEILGKMEESPQYSQAENEKYMSTLTAKLNELKVSAQELAVQLGESGFLDLAKAIVDISKGILKLTKDIGGLNTVISALFTYWAIANKAKISDNLAKYGKQISSSVKGLLTFKTATQGAATATVTFGSALSTALGWIGLAVTAFSIVKGAIDSYKQSQIEAREETIKAGQAAGERLSTLAEQEEAYQKAREEYKKAEEGSGDLEEAQKNLNTAASTLLTTLGKTPSVIQELTGDYDLLDQKVQALTEHEKEYLTIQLAMATAEQEKALKEMSFYRSDIYDEDKFLHGWKSDIFGNEVNVSDSARENIGSLLGVKITDVNNAKEVLSQYDEVLKLIKADLEESGVVAEEYQPYIYAVQWYEELAKAYAEFEKARNGYEEMKNDADSSVSNVAEEATLTLEEVQSNLKSIRSAYTENIDSFQDGYGKLAQAVEDFEKYGILTADTLQSLLSLSPELINLLDVGSDSLSINEQRTQDLTAAQENYMQSIAAVSLAEYALATAKDIQSAATQGQTLAEYYAANEMKALSNEVYAAALAMINGSGSAADLAASITSVGEYSSMTAGQIAALTNAISAYAARASGLLNLYGSAPSSKKYVPNKILNKPSGGGGGGGGSNPERQELQAEIKEWQKKKDEAKDFYDQQIKALKQVKEANDRINDQADYYNNKQTKITDLEKARARSGVEYREKEMEAQQDLIELEAKWNDKVSDWNIDDKIEELESLRDASVAEIDAIVKNLQEKLSSLSSSASGGVGGGGVAGAEIMEEAVDEATEGVKEDLEEIPDEAAEDAKDAFLEMQEEYLKKMQEAREKLINETDATFLQMYDMSRANASNMYRAYKQGFINPLSADIRSLMRSSMSLGQYLTPVLRAGQFATQNNTSNTNYYNSRNNYFGDTRNGMTQPDFSQFPAL